MELQAFDIWEDLRKFNESNLEEKMDEFYKKLPKTECNGCARCCYDSPVITYIEFLYIFNYLIETYKDETIWKDLLTKVFTRFIKGLVFQEQCSFIDDQNNCMIYAVAPLACKRWGIQSDESYQTDSESSQNFNKHFIDYYESKGIHFPEEIKSIKTVYCDNVKIIKNPYNVTGEVIEKEMIKLANDGMVLFPHSIRPNYNVCDYLANSFHKEKRLYFDRIRTIKKLQSGIDDAVDSYIASINIEEKVCEIMKNSHEK